MTRSSSIWPLIIVQGALLIFELVAPYDSMSRRIALMLTNAVATVTIILITNRLRRDGRAGLPWAAMLFTAAAVWLDALGNFFGWYGRWWWWDHLTHGTGTAAITILAGVFLTARMSIGLTVRGMLIVALLVGQTVASWYEVSEYLGDLAFDTHRVGPGYDTARDLWFNALGGGLGMCILWVANRRRKVV